MPPILRLVIVLACIACASGAAALDPSRAIGLYPLDVWRDGLPQYTIQAIAQDRAGYLWLGTFEGLVRFNGLRFDVFDEQRVPQLGSSQIRALCLDHDRVLWIGTTGGGLLQVRDGVPVPFAGSKSLPDANVSALLAARDGSLWVATRNGVARVRDERVESFRVADGLPNGDALALVEMHDGTIVAGTDAGVARFDGKRFQVIPIGTSAPRVLSMTVARDGALWLGTFDDGVYRVQGADQKHYGIESGLPPGNVWTILGDRSGSIWIGSAPGGLLRLRGDRFELLSREQGLPNDAVRALFEDVEGSLWVGTNGGLARLKDLKFVSYSRRNGLSEDNVRVVTQTADGSLWVGTYGGGLNRIREGVVTAYTLSDPFVRTIAAAPDGSIWVGTGSGLNVLRGDEVSNAGAREGLSGDKVQALAFLRDGTLVVTTESGGLQFRRNGRFLPVARETQAKLGKNARVLFEDRRGTLWVGTSDRGVFELRDGRIERQWTTRDGLPNKAIYALHEADDGTLWIGTRSGLCRMRAGKLATIAAAQGLRNSVVFQVIDDGIGNFWLTSNRGLTRVSIEEVNAVLDGRTQRVRPALFTRIDGLASEQCNGATQPAGVRLRDGKLAVPTVNGLTIVDPRNLHVNRTPPHVMLTEALVDGKRVGDGAQLPWRSARFEFRFDGTSLVMPELVGFRYKLQGFDREWIDSNRRRFAMYNSLPPGNYTFRVQARNNDGTRSIDDARVSFTLPAAPWRRWWAILAYLAIVILGVAAIVRVRERTLVQRTIALEERVRERTAALDEANRRLETLSMTDGLTGLANRRSFDTMLGIEWNRACRSGEPLSLILADVDHFKAYNDTYGHQAGDECLRRVATAMQQTISRAGDVVARYGGEEFVVLLPATNAERAAANAERLRAAVIEAGVPHSGSSIADVVTISVGVATVVPTVQLERESLIRAADAALYRAKGEGRNRVVA
ncbi:MAG: diguanylate cyclase [Acidobacteriota bacterium]|nr:diguanylate cyclase [Acidobacteriota bacterium]